VIVRRVVSTTTVPDVIGVDRNQVYMAPPAVAWPCSLVDPARRHRRIGHSRRTDPRPDDLRPGL